MERRRNHRGSITMGVFIFRRCVSVETCFIGGDDDDGLDEIDAVYRVINEDFF